MSPPQLRRYHIAAFLSVILLLLALLPRTAFARSEWETTYTQKQLYNSSLRFLKIELRVNVTEQNEDAGYILFEYKNKGSSGSFGAIEIIPTSSGIKLVVSLPSVPTTHEKVLIEGLKKKLHGDYGQPPPEERIKLSKTKTAKTDRAGLEDEPEEPEAPPTDESNKNKSQKKPKAAPKSSDF